MRKSIHIDFLIVTLAFIIIIYENDLKKENKRNDRFDGKKKKLFAIRKYFKEEKKRKRWKNIGRIKKSL